MTPTWVLRFNADFEYELGAGADYTVHPKVARLAMARAAVMRLLGPAPGEPRAETILLAGRQMWQNAGGAERAGFGWVPLSRSRLKGLSPIRYLPWGVTDSTREEAALLEPSRMLPPSQVVRKIQSREFSLRLEQSMGLALPGMCMVSTLGALLEHLPEGGDWVLKHPFGVAGRERLRLPGGRAAFGTPARAWAERILARHPLVIEPWVQRIRDWSVQLQLPLLGQGPPRVLGVLEQTVLGGGTWVGHRLGWHSPPEGLLEIALKVGAAAQEEGYFGPLGLDAFEFQQGPDVVLRPLVEVNARHTMGMCALALAQRVREQQVWEWRQVERKSLQTPWSFDVWQAERAACLLPGDPRAIRFVCGDGPTAEHSTWGMFLWS